LNIFYKLGKKSHLMLTKNVRLKAGSFTMKESIFW